MISRDAQSIRPGVSPTGPATSAAPAGILVTDFDGTMTREDFFNLVRQAWPIPAGEDPWERFVAGSLSHFDALAQIFARVRADETAWLQLVARMGFDPKTPAAVARLRRAGWEVVVASAGCDWYIRRLLRGAGWTLELHARPGRLREAGWLEMSPPVDSPFFSPANGIDKAAVVRDALRRVPVVAFAGDGRPDLEPALQVPPERRLARGWLADQLRKAGERFIPFDAWPEVADRLLEERAS